MQLTPSLFDRRQLLCRLGNGFGALGLASVLAGEGMLASAAPTAGAIDPLAPKKPHFAAKAKHVIFLFMNGGPSQVDTFDPKPALAKYSGQTARSAALPTERAANGGLMPSPFKFAKHGKSGIEVSELYPEVAKCIDDICVIRSMHTNIPNHEPSLLMMNSGEMQPTRPSLGSWLTYGLGTENQNLPGFVVLCPGKPVVGPQLWSNSFLPGIYQGTHINNSSVDPRSIIRTSTTAISPPPPSAGSSTCCSKLNEQHLEERGEDDLLEARIQSLEMAFRMQFEAQEAFDLSQGIDRDAEACTATATFANACLMARRLVAKRRAHGPGLLRRRPAVGRSRRHPAPRQARQRQRPADRRPAQRSEARGLLEDTLVIWGGEFGRTPTSEGSQGPRPQHRRLHHVAGRRRRQGRHGLRRHRRVRLRAPSRRRSTSTTCTPPSCT